MNEPDARPKTSRSNGLAGGSLLAFSIVAGVVIGTLNRQPSIGFLIGFGVGILLFLLVWLADRRRRP